MIIAPNSLTTNHWPKRLGALSCILGATLALNACAPSSTEQQLTAQTVAAQAVAAAAPQQTSSSDSTTKSSGPSTSTASTISEDTDAVSAIGSIATAKTLAQSQDLMWLPPFTPYTGSEARIYGSPNNGCIAGALPLSDQNETFQLQRWGNDRHYAHPLMLQYLQDLRARAAELELPPLLIGDLSRPYGGPYGPSSAHASHNTGLDVDLPFDFAQPRKNHYELEHPKDNYIVSGKKVRSSFTPEIATYIKLAASDPRVDRVFVAPMIKKHMCALYEHEPDAGFLHKLRPWFGHRAHMHVRLNCPSDSPECVLPKPIPEGSGCGYEVDSWFLPPPPKTQTAANTKPKPKAKKVLPPQCPLILQQYLRANAK